ncbi:MAG TPA: hypothetical protein PK082_05605 [Phycisphaerae bacterium]|nr:hypothetical protein [Phycisphaerae bacterium]
MKPQDEETMRKLLGAFKPEMIPPPSAEERILHRMLTEWVRGEGASGRTQRKRWLLRVGCAAAALAMIVTAFWWLLEGNVPTASADFSEMIRHVRQAETVAYNLILRMPGQAEQKAEVFMARAGRVRIAWPDGTVQLYDASRDKMLTVSPRTRKAVLRSLPVLSNPYAEPLEKLRALKDTSGQFEGKQLLTDNELDVYQVDEGEEFVRIWVDPRQDLPVRVEIHMPPDNPQENGNTEAVIVMKNIRWNPMLPDTLFRLEAPPGYTLE